MTAPFPPAASVPGWQPPVTRPPLTGRAKRSAAIAGGVSFVLLNIGFALFALPIVLGLFAALFTAIIGFVDRVETEADADFDRFAAGIDSLDLEQWTIPLVLVSIVGVVVMVLAIFASTWILKGHGTQRHWPITWSAAGIAIVANVVIGGVVSGAVQGVVSLLGQSTGDVLGAIIVTTVVSAIVTIAVNATIGWLAWWWMVWVFRPADVHSTGASA